MDCRLGYFCRLYSSYTGIHCSTANSCCANSSAFQHWSSNSNSFCNINPGIHFYPTHLFISFANTNAFNSISYLSHPNWPVRYL